MVGLHKFLHCLIFSSFLFHCHILGLKFFYTLSFQKCLFAFCVSLLVSNCLMHMLKVLSIIVFFSLNFSFSLEIHILYFEDKAYKPYIHCLHITGSMSHHYSSWCEYINMHETWQKLF